MMTLPNCKTISARNPPRETQSLALGVFWYTSTVRSGSIPARREMEKCDENPKTPSPAVVRGYSISSACCQKREVRPLTKLCFSGPHPISRERCERGHEETDHPRLSAHTLPQGLLPQPCRHTSPQTPSTLHSSRCSTGQSASSSPAMPAAWSSTASCSSVSSRFTAALPQAYPISETYTYFNDFPKDPYPLRILVSAGRAYCRDSY